MRSLTKYKTWFLDCDGVILDSNKIKSSAFYQVALPYGEEVAERFLNYHQQNGGISRFKKFEFFYQEMLGLSDFQEKLNRSVQDFQDIVKSELIKCQQTPGCLPFLNKIQKYGKTFVVSGGQQDELKAVFKARKMDHYYDGIYGSPKTKYEIIQELISTQKNILEEAVFIGDSELDYKVADYFKIDFIFMNQFTEFQGWKDHFKDKDVHLIKNFECLLRDF